MYHIPNKVDFYITNVCNLTCDRCNRFNNYNFRGWQRWEDHAAEFERWAELISLCSATILGGEPFLNPTLADWIGGINRIFGIEVQVLTNGTRFRQAGDLYNTLLYWSDKNNHRNHIGVSLHNAGEFERLSDDIRWFLKGTVSVYPKGHADNTWNSDWMFEDSNGAIVNVFIVDHFTSAALKTKWQVSGGIKKILTLHNSNPGRAHNSCAFAQFKSYHFIRAKLYKCGPVALMPEFDQQHHLHITDQDRELLNSYVPLSVDNFDSYHREFFSNLDNPIPQCKFCPEEANIQKIFPIRKHSK